MSPRTPSLAPIVTLAALLLASVAQAQPEDQVAQREAVRALAVVQQVLTTTARNEGGPAADALADPSWIVRRVAAVRLRVLGLPAGPARDLERAARPGVPPMAPDAPAITAVRAFVPTLEPDPNAVAGPVSKHEALSVIASVVTEQLKSGDEQPQRKRALVDGLAAYRAAVEPETRAWLARRLLGLTDLPRFLEDEEARSAAEAIGEDGAKAYAWLAQARPYFYWHPKRRQLQLDVEARAAKTPSAEFREANPWGPDEGPNAGADEPGGR